MAKKKNKPAKSKNSHKAMEDLLKRTKYIYSVNGKYRAQLVNGKEGGWLCQIWSISADGERPLIRNIQPFETMEEAIQMARRCFLEYTGDDRYFAKEDIEQQDKKSE